MGEIFLIYIFTHSSIEAINKFLFKSQCCGSGAFLTPGIGSRIPKPYFLELSDKVLGRKFCNYLKTGPNFFLEHFKNKINYNFVKFVVTKNGMTTKFFSPLSLLRFLNPGSEIREPGSGIRDG